MKQLYTTIALTAALASTCATASAQDSINALDHTLQRPRVAKYYKDKKPLDHLFVEAGGGFSVMVTRKPRPDAICEVAIGDWISPEHGVRLRLGGGRYDVRGMKVKHITLGADYMMNLTAIGSPRNNYTQRPLELYGIFGGDWTVSHHEGNEERGFGLHIGMRAQAALSRYSYLYLEPRIGLKQDNVSHLESWHGYRPLGTVTVGLGMRLPDSRQQYVADDYTTRTGSVADGLFLFAGAGATAFVNTPKGAVDYTGPMVAAGAGKWIDHCNAARLYISGYTMRDGMTRYKSLTMHLDYMLNLNNAFAGVNPDRLFWVNAVAGGSYSISSAKGRSWQDNIWGFGGGLQANLRVSRDINFFIEPRIDFMQDDYAYISSIKKLDATASLMAGIVYTYHDNFSRINHRGESSPLRRTSIGLYGGAASQLNHLKNGKYIMPAAMLSLTRWHSPLSGWRMSLQGMARSREIDGKAYAQSLAALDWMADLTALTYGCDNRRVLSLRTVAGAGIGADYAPSKTNMAANLHVGTQMSFRLSGTLSLNVEPTLAYEMSHKFKSADMARLTPKVMAGLEYNMQRTKRDAAANDAPERRHFVSLSGGTGLYSLNGNNVNDALHKPTFTADVSYGHWFTALHGMTAGVSNTTIAKSIRSRNRNITSIHAAYMMNLKSAVTGEDTEDDVFQMTGLLGASCNIGSKSNAKAAVAPGIEAAIQTGARLSRRLEIFLQPSVNVMSKKIEKRTAHPAEVEMNITAGTKIYF